MELNDVETPLDNTTFLNTVNVRKDRSGSEDFKKIENVSVEHPVILSYILKLRSANSTFFSKHKKLLRWILYFVLFILYLVYFVFALRYEFGDEGSIRLVTITCLVCFGILYVQLRKKFGRRIYKNCVKPIANIYNQHKKNISRVCLAVICIGIITFMIIDVILKRPEHLISAVGIILIISIMFLTSHDPAAIKWKTVVSGLLLQFIFALVILRTAWGYGAFKWLAARVTDYLTFAYEGAKFVYGDNFGEHFFAFGVMSIIIFFSSTISVLYYLGWMQIFIEKIVWSIMYGMGTGAMESLHAAVNIFVGWGEALMIVQPLLNKMTTAEIHAVMTNGFSTVAGSTLGVYITYGAPANHLISASFLSAPAALVMTKLTFPDRVEDRIEKKKIPKIPRSGGGVMDAASCGAVAAMMIIGHIIVNVIALVSLLAFINSVLLWFGDRIGLGPPDYAPLTFQLLCSYVFWPLVYILGVPMADCKIVARMVGVKVFVNEFIAYKDLGTVVKNGLVLQDYNGTWSWTNTDDIILADTNTTLIGGVLSKRSEMIATYALCGFSDFVALGIMVAALTSIDPSRKNDILKCGPRALVSGIMACFMTACMAAFVGGE